MRGKDTKTEDNHTILFRETPICMLKENSCVTNQENKTGLHKPDDKGWMHTPKDIWSVLIFRR